ncbi:MAG: hypothetical protein K5669_07795 [Lachnospiraceae bacterium]|nr:hypothetical protein [Lachnospiraceae bacterium]
MSKKNSITSMVLGIASCVLGLNGLESYGILAVAGLVCAILSMNFKKKAEAEGMGESGFVKAAKITSIIGLVLSIIGLVGGIICGICLCVGGGAAAAASALSGYSY